MKYYDALRIWNNEKAHDMYCRPRKGTPEHAEVIAIQNKTKEAPKKAANILKSAIKRKITKPFVPTPAPAPAPIPTPTLTPAPTPTPMQTPFDNLKVIKNFLKDKLILNKYTLTNRINRYKIINKRLDQLKKDDCLEKKGEGYTIRNIVNLEKRIGTKSKIGTIYLTSIPNNLGAFPIASKVMKNIPENILETELMKNITENIILKGYSKHFTIMYKDTLCSKEKYPEKAKLVNYNELCNGDLKTLANDVNLLSNEELVFNLLFQSFISIATFHNILNYTHQDAHSGNFLYQLNNETGYYHYIFKVGNNKIEFYLKSCKYNICIYDFGLAELIEDVQPAGNLTAVTEISNDYDRIVNVFKSKKTGGWVKIPNYPPKEINDKMVKITNELFYIANDAGKQKMKISTFKILMFLKIIDMFKKYSPAGMILNVKPPNVLNDNPYYISM